MNSTEKENIVNKAICCSGTMGKSVADMFLNGHKCAEKEFQKLFLLINYVETLGCYEAPLEETEYTYSNGVLTPVVTTTEYTNCLTEDQADNIATQISKLCDLCEDN